MSPVLVSLEDFATDPALGNFPEASPAQRLVLRLLDGLPPASAEQRELAEHLLGRPWGEDLAAPRKVAALVMGADSGKSLMASALLLHRALFAPLAGLRPGQRGVSLLVAPDTRLATIPLNYVKGVLGTSPLIREEVEGEPTAETIRFHRGSEIVIRPASMGGRAVRGSRFVAALLEEVSFFRDSDYVVNDKEVYRAIRPRLLPGAQVLMVSTPYRKTGLLWEFFQREHGRSEKALVLRAPTSIMRPDVSRADLDEQAAEDPESARAELGAEFLENVSGLFEQADLAECIDGDVIRREPVPGWTYTAATDPSGLRNDPWSLCILGRSSDGGGLVQFVSRSWQPGSSVETVIEEIRVDLVRFGLRSVFADQFGSEVTKAHFTRAGLMLIERPFTSGASSPKVLGFRALKELVLARGIRLLDDPVQTRELQLLEVTRLSGGGERIAAPGRLHDDRACALALAVGELSVERREHPILGYYRLQIGRRAEDDAALVAARAERERGEAWEGSLTTPWGWD